jgi:hypothetical protein
MTPPPIPPSPQTKQGLALPPHVQADVDLQSVVVRGEAFADAEGLAPDCYRCGAGGPLVNAQVTMRGAGSNWYLNFGVLADKELKTSPMSDMQLQYTKPTSDILQTTCAGRPLPVLRRRGPPLPADVGADAGGGVWAGGGDRGGGGNGARVLCFARVLWSVGKCLILFCCLLCVLC